ncbi:MAG: hypothetical protein H6604_02250 [Flavobacteriales bacterium]|nr:hypothetical protein [Flavobacteriales bacterium]
MNNKAHQDLQHIRSLMEKSGKFLSLSGLSGITAGIIALIGTATVLIIMEINHISYFDGKKDYYTWKSIYQIGFTLLITLALSILSAYYFTQKKTKKNNQKLWNSLTKYLLVQLSIPLVCGGILCLLLIKYNLYLLIPGFTLIFYGIALTNCSKHTFSEVFWLGISQIILGLLAVYFIGYGIVFWAIGFGILHIIYGIIMYKKYD